MQKKPLLKFEKKNIMIALLKGGRKANATALEEVIEVSKAMARRKLECGNFTATELWLLVVKCRLTREDFADIFDWDWAEIEALQKGEKYNG